MSLSHQFAYLELLALPVACVSWTVTHEEIFREPREWCEAKSEACKTPAQRKFFYLFTCEYCFGHYVSALLISIWAFSTGCGLDVKHENVTIAVEQNRVEENA